MSRMTPINEKFIRDCEIITKDILSVWADKIKCYYDGDITSKRDYVIEASDNWGYSQCNWDRDKSKLFESLKKVGAINIIGKVRWNYIDIAFDIRKKLLSR